MVPSLDLSAAGGGGRKSADARCSLNTAFASTIKMLYKALGEKQQRWRHIFSCVISFQSASAQLHEEWREMYHLICFLLFKRKNTCLKHFPQFCVLSICFQTLPPFLLWMALIPFPPEVNGTSLNKFPKETTKFCIHPEKKRHSITFFCPRT